jgi:HD superfamily phosphohydrolase
MGDERLEFYDPLYETICFEKGLPGRRSAFVPNSGDPLDPRDIVRTAEFCRLAYLRQAGLAWLVFPSATHTRFAHSIGCWWLGRIAENLVKVDQEESGEAMQLRQWLSTTSLREEFYLALLFHDIGHGPLSHVLERNDQFREALRDAGVIHSDHEHRGAALLLGTGPLPLVWEDMARERYGDTPTFATTRTTLGRLKDWVCLPSVCYLMTGDEEYLSACTHDHQSHLCLVKELVSGLLDLDRLDHYARDSYFSGLRQIAVNVRGFLNNLRMSLSSDGGRKRAQLSLSDDGASHAASLLFSKRQIVSTLFRNSRCVALHAMVNWALSAHLCSIRSAEDKEQAALRIAMMDDDQIMEALSVSSDSGCRAMMRRIRGVHPYALAGKWSNTDVVRTARIRKTIEEYENAKPAGDGAPSVLLRYDDGFWSTDRAAESSEWLDTNALFMENSEKPLLEHPFHKDDFAYIRDANKTRYVWAFVQDDSEADSVYDDLDRLFRRPRRGKS